MTRSLTIITAAAAFVAMAATAHADPIEGMWKTGDDVLLQVSACGGSFCVDVADGQYVGKRSGKLKLEDGKYTGTLKQFSTGISFTGEATLAGNTMSLVARKFGIVVKRDTWRRQ